MRRSTEFYLALWTILFVTAATVVVITQPFSARVEDASLPLTLKVADRNERIRVDWDPRHPAVQSADAATLEVHDGSAFHRYPIEAKVLRSGGLDYLRKSPDVLLTITLYQHGQSGLQTTARTVAGMESPAPPDERRSRRRP
jgi:hypothetical protein